MRSSPSLRILFICSVVFFSLIAAEQAVRFTHPELNPRNHIHFLPETTEHPVLGPQNKSFRQIKNTGDFNVVVQFNAFGFRDDRNISNAGPADYILVGDSFTFGWGVKQEDRIDKIIENITKWRVYNISIPTDFSGYARLLKYAETLGAKPGRVIIAVSMETDLQLYDAKKVTVNAVKELRPRGTWLTPLKSFFIEHSALYILTTTLVHRTSLLRNLAIKAGLLIPNLEGVRKYEFSHAVIESSAIRLKRLAGQYQTTVLVIPSRALWYGSYREVESRRHVAFVKRLRDLGLDVLDLRPVFKKQKNPLSLHFKNDPHWLPIGHRIAAKALADHLRQRYNDI